MDKCPALYITRDENDQTNTTTKKDTKEKAIEARQQAEIKYKYTNQKERKKMTMNRNDFNEEAFDTLIRDTLWDELLTIEAELAEMREGGVFEGEIQELEILQAAMCRVVAYHSIPGSFRAGTYDGS